jgi:arylsulfatase A-like enzyme
MMCDDQRWDAMSLAGNTILKTPNMDRIGREGIVFRNAFVTNSLCGPSRATILTGTYSHTNGMIDNRPKTDIRPDVPWLPDLLRAAGYEVAFCGKSHQKNALRERTWDYYFGYKGRAATRTRSSPRGRTARTRSIPAGWTTSSPTRRSRG